MGKRFTTLQKEASQKGFELSQTANGYHAEWEGIGLDDDDAERLFADMDAVMEVSQDDSGFTLEEEPDENGQAVITAEGLDGDFRDVSIAEALRKAKEARLAKQKPQGLNKSPRSFGRKPKEESPAKVEAAPAKVEPWEDPAPNGPAPAKAPAPATDGDREQFLDILEKLTGVLIETRDRMKALLAQAPVPAQPRPNLSGRK